MYTPENIAGAFRASDHSRLWAEQGHDVTIFTGWPHYPMGKVFDGYHVESLVEEADGKVRVLRSGSIIQPTTSFLKRIIDGGSFFVYGAINCLVKKDVVGSDYDVTLASCGPVFTGCLGHFFSRIRKTKFVVEFRDITYRQMAATGTPENSWKVKLMRLLEIYLCREADHVVVLTEGFADVLASEGISREKMSVVPNGADMIACDHTWSNNLRLGYFGTMGVSQDVPRTLRCMRALANRGQSIRYLLVGEGAARGAVEDALGSGDYPFAELKHGMSKDELEAHYANVDMTVVSLQKSEDFSATVPSKIFQSFARGVPVLFIGPEGEAARIVRESGAGIAMCGTETEDIDDFARFSAQPELPSVLEQMSGRATAFIERSHTRRRMSEGMLDAFERSLAERNQRQ